MVFLLCAGCGSSSDFEKGQAYGLKHGCNIRSKGVSIDNKSDEFKEGFKQAYKKAETAEARKKCMAHTFLVFDENSLSSTTGCKYGDEDCSRKWVEEQIKLGNIRANQINTLMKEQNFK